MSKQEKSTPTYQMIKSRVDNADLKGVDIVYGYNNELQSPYIHYYNSTDKTYNIIIYEDKTSVTAKIDLAKSYGLSGISIWSLGNIPDYKDKKGKEFGLDVWNGVLSSVKGSGAIIIKNAKKVRFTNKKIEAAARNYIGKKTGDIYISEIEKIYRLRLPSGVGNLSDLKFFKSLEYLDIQNASVRDITPVGSLTNLRTLYLQRNQISDIKALKTLKKLQVLSLNGNRITDVKPLGFLVNLQKLYVKENRIKDISAFKSLVKLDNLYLSGNFIKDFSATKEYFNRLLEFDFVI